MVMPGRKYSAGMQYRYGFNGKEEDDEVKGDGNSLDFGARIYDPRLGRWFSPDKMEKDAPSISTYVFVENTPLAAIDPDGNRTYFIGGAGYNPNPGGISKLLRRMFSRDGDFTTETQKAFSGILGDEFRMVTNSSRGMLKGSYWSLLKGTQPILNIADDQVLQSTVNEIVSDYLKNRTDPTTGLDKPLNLMGSSYGSVMTAQVAVEILSNPQKYGDIKITSVTLSASPINENSELYNKLEEFRKNGTLGKIILDPNNDDAVTGAAGSSPNQGRRNFFKLIFSKNTIVSKKHPHNQAAKDKNRTYDRMLRKTIGSGTEGEENQKKALELIEAKTPE
jgi:RHS repeat-associated protein